MDPMGRAIADYWKTMVSTNRPKKASKLRVFSPMFEEDEIPLATLFRSYESMPEIERMALDMAKGRVLDVGAGSGCHSLVLQERGIDVTAIDISPLSVEAMKERGLKKVYEQDFFTLDGQAMEQREPSSLLEWPSRDRVRRSQYDTILMLMNGIGIVGTLERLPDFFRQLDKILAPDGQVLCDSSDISYVFEDEDGIIEYPDTDGYYGEQSFQMQYKDTIGEPFPWLYIDAVTLKQVAKDNGYTTEVVAEGEHYDYLARITKK
jgi:SAM-dependent methyltransferase